jgi:hypothetical protein
MAEPGFLTLTDGEVAAFRGYLLKGGFVIFDDFAERRGGWDNFEAQMRRVLPEGRFVDLDASNPIFHAFFEIPNLDIIPQYYDTGKPIFRGIYENNDPTKRLLVMVKGRLVKEYRQPPWDRHEVIAAVEGLESTSA